MQILKDKLLHFVVGAIVAGAAAAAAQVLGVGPGPMAAVGMMVALGAGIGREAWQRVTTQGMADPMDALATVAGGLLATAAMLGAAL